MPAPVLIIFAIVVFYTGLWVLNIPFEYASDMGIVLRPGPVQRSFVLNLLADVGLTKLYAVLHDPSGEPGSPASQLFQPGTDSKKRVTPLS